MLFFSGNKKFSAYFSGKTAKISGWGGESYEDVLSPVLKEASAQFVNNSICLAHEFEMSPIDVCLSGVNGATTCFADGGGPVIVGGELVALLSPKEYQCNRWRSFAAVDLSRVSSWVEKQLEPTPKLLQ